MARSSRIAGGMQCPDRRKLAVGAFKGDYGDGGRRLFDQSEMHLILVAPQTEQRGARVDQRIDGAMPSVARDE